MYKVYSKADKHNNCSSCSKSKYGNIETSYTYVLLPNRFAETTLFKRNSIRSKEAPIPSKIIAVFVEA